PMWTTNGVLLSGVTAVQPPRIVPDGAGGAIVVWPTGAAIQAQRIDAGGTLHAGWPANGMVITTDVSGTSDFAAVSGGAGRAYITRHKPPPGSCGSPPQQAVLLTRIDSNGSFASGWTASGLALYTSDATGLLAAAPDAVGGVLCGFNYWF